MKSDVIDIVDYFISAMEGCLAVKREIVGLEDQWAKDDPLGTGQVMAKYLEKVLDDIFMDRYNARLLTVVPN